MTGCGAMRRSCVADGWRAARVERLRDRPEVPASRRARPRRRSGRRCPPAGRRRSRTTARPAAPGGRVYNDPAARCARRPGEHLEPERAGGRGAVPRGRGGRAGHASRSVSHRRPRSPSATRSGTGARPARSACTRSRSMWPIRPTSGEASGAAWRPTPPSRRHRPRRLENARLLYQAELAADYFQIQGLDAERQLLDATVKSYEQYAQLTQDRFEGGVASMADVALAQTQLETARAQLVDLGIARAQFEHAIAVLTGKPPSALSMPAAAGSGAAAAGARRPSLGACSNEGPTSPPPSGRWRPRTNRSASPRRRSIPSLIFGASAGSQAAAIVDLLTVADPLLVRGRAAGRRRCSTRQAPRSGQADRRPPTTRPWRTTGRPSLTAFQQVEDGLAELRMLGEEAEIADRAVAAAQQSLDISTIQYRGGLANYLQVITAQTSLLQNQRTAVDMSHAAHASRACP